jgi:hypothetical protein
VARERLRSDPHRSHSAPTPASERAQHRIGRGHQLGFSEIQFREADGKAGQQLLVFGDDFTLLTPPVPPIPALDAPSALIVALLLVLGGMAASFRSRRTLGSDEPR